jgi:hypothetical protein
MLKKSNLINVQVLHQLIGRIVIINIPMKLESLAIQPPDVLFHHHLHQILFQFL